jgi:hypothetical protein
MNELIEDLKQLSNRFIYDEVPKELLTLKKQVRIQPTLKFYVYDFKPSLKYKSYLSVLLLSFVVSPSDKIFGVSCKIFLFLNL